MPFFNLQPTFSTFLQEAYTFGIMENPEVPSRMLNWHIQLVFPWEMFEHREWNFAFHPPLSMGGYAKLGVLNCCGGATSLPEDFQADDLPRTLAEILQSGRYALVYLDYFYLPGTAQHRKEHFRHDCLLFDYDAGRREFRGALYTASGNFGEIRIPRNSIYRAFTSRFARGEDCYRYCRGDLLAIFEPAENKRRLGKLDMADIRAQLRNYFAEKDDGKPLNNGELSEICALYRRNNLRLAFGLGVYEPMGAYLAHAFDRHEARNMLRVTRLLWEHKKLMTIRLARISAKAVPLNPRVLGSWARIERLAYWIHIQAVSAARRRNSALLKSVRAGLEKLKGLESAFLERLLQKL